MPTLNKFHACVIVLGGVAIRPVLGAQLLTFDAQSNPPGSNPPELLYGGSSVNSPLTAGPGSRGNGDGAVGPLGVAPGLNITTPLHIAPGILGEQNNTNGSTTFYDVTLVLSGLNASGSVQMIHPIPGNTSVTVLKQPFTSGGAFGFYSSNVGGGPGVALLTGAIDSSFINGGSGASTASFQSVNVTYTGGALYNQLIAQGGATTGGVSISMNNLNSPLGVDSESNQLTSFNADANGQFNVSSLPEPSALGALLIGGIGLLRRPRD